MRRVLCATAILGLLAGVPMGCNSSTAPDTKDKRAVLQDDSDAALKSMQADDPSLKDFLSTGYGYVIFPSVGKGAVGIGGAFGRGIVYESGITGYSLTGYAKLSQATIGVALGGQTYRELVVFQTKDSFNAFKASNYSFSANASAVAIKSGAAAAAKYDNGVAVFTDPNGGLMFEASIGGQQLTYIDKADANSINSD
jgi:lipid-binding SYLF domain-containing protein